MLSRNQEKIIISLQTKKGRAKHGLCLVEGAKTIKAAGNAIQYSFTLVDTKNFNKLVTTETPQDMAGVAKIPEWTLDDIKDKPTIVVLDRVQDPGNVGAILRLCLGFNASLILVGSVDVTNPKVIRSSAGTLFQVPWVYLERNITNEALKEIDQPVYRLEKTDDSKTINNHIVKELEEKIIIIAGSEGRGIELSTPGTSLSINHSTDLESLNVTHALAIILHQRYLTN